MCFGSAVHVVTAEDFWPAACQPVRNDAPQGTPFHRPGSCNITLMVTIQVLIVVWVIA